MSIQDESEKARLLFEIADGMGISRSSIIHIGDTLGASRGICEVAHHGGIGIAFNYKHALKTYLEARVRTDPAAEKILLISPKSETSGLRSLLQALRE